MKIITNKLLIITILIINIIFCNIKITKAVTYKQKILEVGKDNRNGIELFPESYQNELNKLVENTGHFNWKFRPFYTEIDWNELVSKKNENKCLKNTIYKSGKPKEWLCECNQQGDSGYFCASDEIVNYYLDPRNFLTEKTIFQFLDLSNTTKVSVEQIEKAVKGTYLEGKVGDETYAKIIYDAATESGEGAFSIVVRIFQELGKGKELPYMISGKDKDFPGVYNFFNYGATDGEGNLKRGLEYAKKQGWTTPRKALIEGAKLVAGNYTKAGQVNKYLYKFDVVGEEYNQLYNHQYMTNIQDPNSQALLLHNTYNNSGLIDKDITFIIPIYKNMPAYVKKPHQEKEQEKLYYVSSNYDSVNWRDVKTHEVKSTLAKDTIVTMIEKDIKTINGIKFSKIMKNGEEGYMATEYLAPVNNKKDEYKIPNQIDKYLGGNKDSSTPISYSAQIQDIGWTNCAMNGQKIGIIGAKKRIETIKVTLQEQLKCEVLQYRVYVEDMGWTKWVSDGNQAGTVGQSKSIKAIEMKLRENANYNILYRVCINGSKWTDWVKDGKTAGIIDKESIITAFEVKVVEADPLDNKGTQYKGTEKIDNTSLINYNMYLKKSGWTGWRKNGENAGSEEQKRKIEALKIQLSDKIKDESILYRIHLQDIGWTEWKENGEVIGIPDGDKRFEAIELKLKNGKKYNVKYRVHVQDIGWMDWVSNGKMAGTEGKAKRIEGIQIKLEEKEDLYSKVDISYSTHVQDIGWMDFVSNGKISGTEGKAKRLEAIKIIVKDSKGNEIKDAIKYKVHVQDIGWMDWTSAGKMAGTEGKAKRLEAIKIELDSKIKKKIKYRVHVQDIGWMDWVSNGQMAGTEGKAKRLEAIEIKIE